MRALSKIKTLIRPRERQLPKPGIIGRAGRFLVGLFALSFVAEVLPQSLYLVARPPSACGGINAVIAAETNTPNTSQPQIERSSSKP